MIKATVKNLADEVIAEGEFVDQAALNQWVADNVAAKSWGEADRWIEESRLFKLGLDPLDAVETSTLANPYPAIGEPSVFNLYRYPVEYTITSVDVTTENLETSDLDESVNALNDGLRMVAEIRKLNKRKLAAATMDQATFTALLQDATAAQIERALWTGSFGTAKALMLTFDSGDVFYNAGEKTALMAKIDELIAKYP